jgi:activating signal cointegrator complex subunit 2
VQVVFDESVQACLGSCLLYLPRPHEATEVGKTYADVAGLVLRVYVRLSRASESKLDFLSPAAHAAILYENWLFDIPKLMDLAALFGAGNAALVTQMVASVFHAQPKFLDVRLGAWGEGEGVASNPLCFRTWHLRCKLLTRCSR